MKLWVGADHQNATSANSTLDELETEFEEVSVRSGDSEAEERLFPGLEDPVIQEILISVSTLAATNIYNEIKSRIGSNDVQIQLSTADVEELKWEYMEAETGLSADELDTVETHAPEEIGDMWLFEFVDEDRNKHQLKIYVEDLSFEHKRLQ